MPLSVSVQGGKIPTESEEAELELDVQKLKTIGFEAKYVVVTKEAYPKIICEFKGADLAKARVSLQAMGFDLTAYRPDGRIEGWQITKRTMAGTGWS
jgi:hypothetical protein